MCVFFCTPCFLLTVKLEKMVHPLYVLHFPVLSVLSGRSFSPNPVGPVSKEQDTSASPCPRKCPSCAFPLAPRKRRGMGRSTGNKRKSLMAQETLKRPMYPLKRPGLHTLWWNESGWQAGSTWSFKKIQVQKDQRRLSIYLRALQRMGVIGLQEPSLEKARVFVGCPALHSMSINCRIFLLPTDWRKSTWKEICYRWR